MSAENQSRIPDVRITYHANGSARVNDVPVVATEPGKSVRDTAYQVAVALVVAAGASEPVAATSVEPDGTAYPITLYPLKAVAAGASAVVGAAAVLNMSERGRKSGATSPNGESLNNSGIGAGGGADDLVASLEGPYRRARRAWYRPRLSMSWLVAGACASVLVSVLTTVLLRENDPSFVRLSVDTENAVTHSPPVPAMGEAMASMRDAVPGSGSNTKAAKTTGPGAQKRPQPPKASPHTQSDGQASSGDTQNGADTGADDTTDGLPQPSNTVPLPAPGPKPKPASGNAGKPAAAVTNLAVALVGGDQSDELMAYVITVSTSNASPVTLTYTYAGAKGRAPVKRSVVLSGQTNYALADVIPAQPYCGGLVTLSASSTPAASNGKATATAPPGC